MAKGTGLAVWLDLQNRPLGTGPGENFTVAANYVIPEARIYVRNWSRTRPWKKLMVPVSARRGAEDALIYDKELAKIYNVDTLYKTAETGRDMSRYKEDIHTCIFSFKVAGQTYAIPPARDKDSEPPKVEVQEGAWDLFLGNYDRMHGWRRDEKGKLIVDASGNPVVDPQIQQAEVLRKLNYWSRRHNPVFRVTDDGVSTDIPGDDLHHGKYAFLEFIREPVKPLQEVLDKEYLSALDLMEVTS